MTDAEMREWTEALVERVGALERLEQRHAAENAAIKDLLERVRGLERAELAAWERKKRVLATK